MAEFCKKGMNEKEAFRLACLRIGSPRKLNKEFRKGRGLRWNLPRLMTACTVMFFCCIWVWSHYAKHSLFYGWPNGNISVVIDKGIVQFQLNRRNSEDDVRHANNFLYDPRTGFKSGFEWDEYRRHATSGRGALNAWGPKTGLAGLLANYGFASWSLTWGQALSFGSSFKSRVIIAPIWFLALMAVLPVIAKTLALQSILAARSFRIRLRKRGAHNLWKIKPAST